MSDEVLETNKVRTWRKYPCYQTINLDWLDLAPRHWTVKRLKWSITSCQNGIWGEDPTGNEDDVGCVRVADFDRQRFVLGETVELTRRSVPKEKQVGRLLTRGELLLEKSGGGDNQPVGAVVLFDSDAVAVCSNFVAKVGVAEGYCGSYLRYLHAYLYANRVNTRSMKQATGIQNLDSGQYFDEKVAFPSLVEQRAIAAFLDRETARIDALIAKKQRLIELLEEKRQAVISHAVTRGLNPSTKLISSGSSVIGSVPSHWRRVRVKQLFQFCKRQNFPDEIVLSVYREFGVIEKSTRDDNHNKTPTDLSSYQLVMPGDLVINKMKAWQGSLGVSEIRGITSPDYVVYSPKHSEHLPYLHNLLRSRQLASYYSTISNGIRTDQWRLEPEKFEQSILFLPPHDEQIAIASFISKSLESGKKVQEKISEGVEKLKDYRFALISTAVTGQIDVREEVQLED